MECVKASEEEDCPEEGCVWHLDNCEPRENADQVSFCSQFKSDSAGCDDFGTDIVKLCHYVVQPTHVIESSPLKVRSPKLWLDVEAEVEWGIEI